MKKLSVVLVLTANIFANNYQISHSHLNEITQDSEAVFKPIAIEERAVDEKSKLDGIRKRIVITYSNLRYSDVETEYNVNREDENLYNLSNEEINEMLKKNTVLEDGRKISIEYLVTDKFSIELSDTYRKYSMNGRHVGYTEGGFLEEDRSDVYEIKNTTELNDIQLGVKYAIRLIDTPEFKLDISPGVSAGVVHVKSDSKTYYNGEKYEENHYNDIGGYSYGVSLEAKAIFWDRFFVSVGAESRSYVIAPQEYSDGFSQQIDQSGVNIFLGVGVRF